MIPHANLQEIIAGFDSEPQSTQSNVADWPPTVVEAIHTVVSELTRGNLRVADNITGEWRTHAWIKKAILLYFRLSQSVEIVTPPFQWFDKIPIRQWQASDGVRAVPGSVVREGAYIASGCILMPSFVNIGAHVDTGTMIDTWATVGSCAQIGARVHLSGGVGVGGVLEPLQAQPVIIEDDVFVGSRAVVVEGVRLGKGSVIAAGVTLTSSTTILDVSGSQTQTFKGWIPDSSVVIPGTRAKQFAAGEYQVPCALIIGKRSDSTDKKTSLNQALREFQISV